MEISDEHLEKVLKEQEEAVARLRLKKEKEKEEKKAKIEEKMLKQMKKLGKY